MSKTYYICDGNEHCRYRKDGKKNEYCYMNAGENEWCKHTSNKEHAKYKVHSFETREGGHKWEVEPNA